PDAIKHVLESMLDAFADNSREAYCAVAENSTVAKALTFAKKGDYESFYLTLCYPIDLAIDGLLAEVTASDEAKFLFKYSEFVERHYRRLIELCEGSACCADKSRTIMRALLSFYVTGEKIQFNLDQTFTYHLPQTIFTTHEEIVAFFRGLHLLHYGRPETYLQCMISILSLVKRAKGARI
ncbi:MAG: hypothetical protein OEW08_12480, partial [Gammaproteobacteria bacterium]|nr:hypothetical protein [Gammaproteobacteria bacterium]